MTENKEHYIYSEGKKQLKNILDLLEDMDDSDTKSTIKKIIEVFVEEPIIRSKFYPYCIDDEKVIQTVLDYIRDLYSDKLLSSSAIIKIQEKLEEIKK